MKCLVVFILLSTLGLTIAVPGAIDLESEEKYLPSTVYAPKEQHKDEASALLQALVSISLQSEAEEDQDMDDGNVGDDGAVADLQVVFNVLAQVDSAVKAHQQQDDKNVAMGQLWGRLGSALWKAGKNDLKQKYCTKEEKVIAMLQELIGDNIIDGAVASEQEDVGSDENAGDGDDKARTELQTLFNALKKADAKIQCRVNVGGHCTDTENPEKIKKWRERVKHWFGKRIGWIARKYLC
jgi:hypothetical protein